MWRSTFAAAAAALVLLSSPAHAIIHCAANPFHPLCCPAPCPVIDATLIQKFVNTARDLGKSGDFLFVAESAFSAARQTIGLISSFSWAPPGVSSLARDDGLDDLADLWRVSSSASDERQIQVRLERLASQLAVSALAEWSVRRTSTPASWAPAASSLASGGDVTTLAQAAGKGLSALTLLRIEGTTSQTATARHAAVMTALRPVTVSSAARDEVATAAPPRNPTLAQAITDLELSLVPIVGWNNDRASALSIAARYDDLAYAIVQHVAAVRQVDVAQQAVEDVVARAYRDPRAARISAVQLLRERDQTNYEDSFVKGLAAQRAGTELYEVLSVAPKRLGAPTGDPFCQETGDDRSGGQACLVRVLDASSGMLEALKLEAFWRQPRADAEATRLRLLAMLAEIASRNGHDPLASDATSLQQRAAGEFLARVSALEPVLAGTAYQERFTRQGAALRDGAATPSHITPE